MTEKSVLYTHEDHSSTYKTLQQSCQYPQKVSHYKIK